MRRHLLRYCRYKGQNFHQWKPRRAEQGSSLLPATSQHGHSWHQVPLGPMAIYLFNVKTFVFFFVFSFGCSSFNKKGGVGLFYNLCSLTTPYSTWGHIKVGDIYILYIIHKTQADTKFYYIQGHMSMQDSAAAYASNLFKLKKQHLDTSPPPSLSLLYFLCLASPCPVACTFGFSWFRMTSACLLHNLVIINQQKLYTPKNRCYQWEIRRKFAM
jgi:hypothetical protein